MRQLFLLLGIALPLATWAESAKQLPTSRTFFFAETKKLEKVNATDAEAILELKPLEKTWLNAGWHGETSFVTECRLSKVADGKLVTIRGLNMWHLSPSRSHGLFKDYTFSKGPRAQVNMTCSTTKNNKPIETSDEDVFELLDKNSIRAVAKKSTRVQTKTTREPVGRESRIDQLSGK